VRFGHHDRRFAVSKGIDTPITNGTKKSRTGRLLLI
jgi:hypothetical protein